MAQDKAPRFSYLDASDGLSQNSVNDIFQDEWGYLWFATQDGLNRYDGYDYKVYRPNTQDEWSISDNFITEVYPADSGNLWVMCRYGLNYFDRSSERFYKFYIGSVNTLSQPWDITYWNGQWVAVIAAELFVIPDSFKDSKTILTNKIDLDIDSLGIAYSLDDALLLTSPNELSLVHADKSIESLGEIGISESGQRVQRSGDHLYFATKSTGYSFDINTHQLDTFCSDISFSQIQDILPRPDGSIWVAHLHGISVIRDGVEALRIEHDPEVDGSLSYPLVHSLFEDRQGTIWAGTANGGLNYTAVGAGKFKHFNEQDGLTNDQVWEIFPEDSGRVWIGTELGLNLMENDVISNKYPRLRAQFAAYRITAFYKDAMDNYWIGTSRSGLYLCTDLNKLARRVSLDAENVYQQSISTIIEREDGIWVGTLGYLHHLEFDGQLIRSYDDKRDDGRYEMVYILSLTSFGDQVLIGAGQGMYVLNPKTDEVESFEYHPSGGNAIPNFQFVTDMLNRKEGTYLSTFGGGLNLFNHDSKTFDFYSIPEGLSNNVLAGMVGFEDEIWVSHNSGISRFDIATQTFSNYGVSDGLPFPEFSLGASASAPNGDVYFGGTGGVIRISPNDFGGESFDPLPIISDFNINYGQTKTC